MRGGKPTFAKDSAALLPTAVAAALSFAQYESKSRDGTEFSLRLTLTTGETFKAMLVVAEDEWIMVRLWREDDYDGDVFISTRHVVRCEVLW